MSCPCADDRPFPQPFDTISVTNWIEFARIDDIHEHARVRNLFEVRRTPIPAKRIKEIVGAFNIFTDTYNAYQLAVIESNRIKLTPISMDTLTTPKTVYFFVNKLIDVDLHRLEQRMLEIWRTRAGSDKFGSVYFPSTPTRFPYVMPSRYVTFR